MRPIIAACRSVSRLSTTVWREAPCAPEPFTRRRHAAAPWRTTRRLRSSWQESRRARRVVPAGQYCGQAAAMTCMRRVSRRRGLFPRMSSMRNQGTIFNSSPLSRTHCAMERPRWSWRKPAKYRWWRPGASSSPRPMPTFPFCCCGAIAVLIAIPWRSRPPPGRAGASAAPLRSGLPLPVSVARAGASNLPASVVANPFP